MAKVDGASLYRQLENQERTINSLSRDELLAVKNYNTFKNQQTFSTEKPLGATGAGRKKLAAQNAALPPIKPVEPKNVVEPPKTYTQLFEEYIPYGKEISSGLRSAGEALIKSPITGPLLTAIDAPVSSLQDIVASKTTPKAIDDRSLSQIFSAQKTGMGQAGAEYLKQKGVTEPTLAGLKDFNVSDIAQLIQSTLGGVSKREDAALDITKNIYAQSAMASRGLSAQQAMQEADAWAKRNPKLARTSAFSTDVLLDPYAIPVGKAISAVGKAVKKAPAPAPAPTVTTKPLPSNKLQRRYPGLLTPKAPEPKQQVPTPEPEPTTLLKPPAKPVPVQTQIPAKPVPTQQVPTTTAVLPEPEPVVATRIPEPTPVVAKPEPPALTPPATVLPEPKLTPTTATLPEPTVPTTTFKLPQELTKSNPRYGYGDKKFEVEFESDLDKALYVIAGTTKSRAHDKFVDALVKYTGLSEPELKVLGQQVRQVIKNQAKGSPAGKLRIAETGVFTKQTPTAIPAPPTTAPTPAVAKTKPAKKLTTTETKKLTGYVKRISSGKPTDALDPDEATDAVLLAVRKGIIEPEYATKPTAEGIARIKAVAPAPKVKPTPTATKTKPAPAPVPKDPTVITTKNISPEIAQIAQQWKRMMNITEDVLIIDPGDIINIPSRYKKFQSKLFQRTSETHVHGTYFFDGWDNHVILLKPQKSIGRTLELLSHEMGHMLMQTEYRKASKNIRDAIDAEYDAWYQKNKAPTNLMSDLAKNLRAYRSGKGFKKSDYPISMLTQDEKDYFLGKDEWFADQVARWATTTAKPLTVVEKFFARLANVMKQFFQVNKEYLPTKTMKDWLDGLEKSAKNNVPIAVKPDRTVGEIIVKDFADQFSKNKSKDPKIESVLTAVKPTEMFKEKFTKAVQEVTNRTLAVFKAYSKLSESQRERFFKGQTKIADAPNEAVRDVDNITKPLKNAEEFDAFRRIVILRDLYQTGIRRPNPKRQIEINDQIKKLQKELRDLASSTSVWKNVFSKRIERKIYMLNAELNPILPDGLTVKGIVQELRRLENEHLGNPNIRKALNNYKTLMKKVFDDLVKRGKISAERERTDYYPHDVFDSAYALDFDDPSGMGRKFESPYRFYTQQRAGSKKPINANFEEVITNTLTKVYIDNAIDDLAETVIPEVDILRQIKAKDVENPDQAQNIRRAQALSKMRVLSGRDQAVQRSGMVDLSDKIVDIDGERYRFYTYGDQIHLIPENLYEELKTFREPQDNFFLVPFQKTTGIFKGTAIAVSGLAHQTMNLLSGISNLAGIDPKALLNAGRAAKIVFGSKDKELQQGVAKIILGQPNPQGVKASDIDENIRVFAIDNGIIEPLQRSSNVHRFSPTWRKIASWMNVLRFTRNVSQRNDEFLRMMKLIADYDRALDGKPPKTRGIVNTDGLDIEQKITRTAHEFFINPKRQSRAMRSFVSQLMFPFINWAANSSVQTVRYIQNNPKKSAVAFLAFPALLETWNNTEERAKIEELLPEDKRKIPHYITDSVDESGKPIVLYFNFLPGLSFFDLTNLDYIPQNVSDVLLGRKTGEEALETVVKKRISAPTDIIENFANPMFKTPFELYFNRSLYTDKDIIPPSQKGTSQGLATGLEYALKSTVPPARAFATAQTKIESAEPTEKVSVAQALGDTLVGIASPLKQIKKPEDLKKLEESAMYRKIEKGTISANKQKQDILKPAFVNLLVTGDVGTYRKEIQKTNLRSAQIRAYRDANLEELLSEALQKTKDKNKKAQLLERLEAIRKREERELKKRARRANE